MNSKITFLVLLCLPLFGRAQSDIPTAKPLKIEAANKLDEKGKTDKGTALRIPDVIKDKPNINFKDSLMGRKPVKMLPDKKLLQAGHNMKIDPKVGPRTAKEGSKDHFPDQNLGEIKSNGKFVGIVCRDHEYVDGDRVKIYVNGKVADPNILLTGAFKGVNADLEKGFNQLVFEALNEGSSSPNTAQIDVYDDQGQMIYSNKWLLSAGSKASLIITKE
ncbi:MAG: hypothetical protein Mars2KO_21700 [Maribacter sp.]|uniref:hypothetical protein n=1 Tax=Maribacter sp. 2307UL18-2 TaxID=3386274 RepID=UPI0039BC3C6D